MNALHRPSFAVQSHVKRSVRTFAQNNKSFCVPMPKSMKEDINRSVSDIVSYATKPVTEVLERIESKLESIDQRLEKMQESLSKE